MEIQVQGPERHVVGAGERGIPVVIGWFKHPVEVGIEGIGAGPAEELPLNGNCARKGEAVTAGRIGRYGKDSFRHVRHGKVKGYGELFIIDFVGNLLLCKVIRGALLPCPVKDP